jgi:hypothetical protein
VSNKIGRFLSLPIGEQLLILRYSIALPVIEVSLKLLGFKTISRILLSWPKVVIASSNSADAEVERQARILSIVKHNHPLPGKCLSQSLALWWSLRRFRIESDLRIGFCKENSQFLSHAWVEYKGKPLVNAEGVRDRFVVFDQPASRDWIWSS